MSGINLNNQLFTRVVSELIKEHSIQEIIETGTFNGLGSTTVFAKTNLPVISIDSCKNYHLQAKKNLENYRNVTLKFGSSLKIKEMEEFIKNDDFYNHPVLAEKNIKTDGDKDFYINEINGFGTSPSEEDLLFDLIDNTKRQIVFLDSAGGIGYLEFLKFMSLKNKFKKNKILLLDDILHIKHYRSVLHLKRDKHDVYISQDNRFAYCTFKGN